MTPCVATTSLGPCYYLSSISEYTGSRFTTVSYFPAGYFALSNDGFLCPVSSLTLPVNSDVFPEVLPPLAGSGKLKRKNPHPVAIWRRPPIVPVNDLGDSLHYGSRFLGSEATVLILDLCCRLRVYLLHSSDSHGHASR